MKTKLHLGRTVALLLPFAVPFAAMPSWAGTGNHTPIPLPGTGTLLGAGAALSEINPPKAAAAKTPGTQTTGSSTELRKRMKELATQGPTLPPAEAAKAWLDLADRFVALSQKPIQGAYSRPIAFTEIVAVLPPPAAWPEIARAIEARQPHKTNSQRDLTLALLAHVLTENKAKQESDRRALVLVLKRSGSFKEAQSADTLSYAMIRVSGDKKALAQIVHSTPASRRMLHVRWATPAIQRLPDLVSLEGRAKAEAKLRSELLTSTAQIEIPLGDETRQLARRLALGLVPRLRVPQWRLANSIDSMQLFKAMEARFVTPAAKAAAKTAATKQAVKKAGGKTAAARRGAGPMVHVAPAAANADYRVARTYYLLGLIASGHLEESVNLADRLAKTHQLNALPPQALQSLDEAGQTIKLNYFLREVLTRNPNLPLWGTYIAVAARAGQTSDMLTLVRKRTNSKSLKPEQSIQLGQNLCAALLAADRLDEGVALMRQLIASPRLPRKNATQASLAIHLTKLGKVTHHPAWIAEGLKALQGMRNFPPDYEDPDFDYESLYSYDGAPRVQLLIQVGRDGEAEKALIASITGVAKSADAGPRPEMVFEPAANAAGQLTALAGIYHRRGRHQDVLELLNHAAWWGARDLADNYTNKDSTGTPLGYMVASVLAATGRRDEALPIVLAVLESQNGYDPAYALLTRLEGEKSLSILDGLFQEDRFEERPLIWKASVLLAMHRLEEAEAVVRQAIAIDPSDGEQGKGDRMRAYAVLADIRAARGDAVQAKFFRGAVTAIRVAENADDLYSVGLLTRGIKMYEQALTSFSDAYCIQSRLAINLAATGHLKEAAEHYRRAYELMPYSFGRMESHCFGCEGAFQGQNATNIAESVFKRLLKSEPNKPQLHYLMGYLREEQGRTGEALAYYRRATQLDHDYINAWTRLLGTGMRLQLPQADREAATLNLLRLDPGFRHTWPDASLITNLKQFWLAVDAAQKHRKARQPGKLYALTASIPIMDKQTELMTKRRQAAGLDAETVEEMGEYYDEALMDGYLSDMLAAREGMFTPSRIIARQTVLVLLANQMDARFPQSYRGD